MDDRLRPILEAKRQHVARQKLAMPFDIIQQRAREAEPPRGFIAALERKIANGDYGLIAEIKRASPSKGLIRADFDPPALARAYRDGGAACLSVLTDMPYFQGDDSYLQAVKAAVDLPVLRKDFIVDPYQIAESRTLGADCILLIMAALDDAEAGNFYAVATAYGMDVLVEVHNEAELHRALALKPRLLGINNRNLKTLEVDVRTSLELASLIPPGVLAVAESGLATPADLAKLAASQIDCFLIGETLMRQDDVAAATRALLIAQ